MEAKQLFHQNQAQDTNLPGRREALELGVSELLREHKISTAAWGTGSHKSFRSLVDEIEKSEARLDLFEGRLYRFASVVRVDVRYASPLDGKSLQLFEAEQRFADGRCRIRGSDFAVWEKLKIGEAPELGLSRALHEELGIQGPVFVIPGTSTTIHRPPLDFPGIPCRLTTNDFTACIRSSQYCPSGYEERQPDKTTVFRWRLAAAPPVTVNARRFLSLSPQNRQAEA
jgi:hypothetical protein